MNTIKAICNENNRGNLLKDLIIDYLKQLRPNTYEKIKNNLNEITINSNSSYGFNDYCLFCDKVDLIGGEGKVAIEELLLFVYQRSMFGESPIMQWVRFSEAMEKHPLKKA